jgi:NAD(P)-dependent dehydrogenase (short-subunit alcohol dehydrogenase family)
VQTTPSPKGSATITIGCKLNMFPCSKPVWFSESTGQISSVSCRLIQRTVTGASSGLGRAVTELVLQEGHNVVATLRQPSMLDHLSAQYGCSRLVVLQLDVSIKADVAAAFARARVAFGRIDVVYSNAGYTIIGEVEESPDELARPLFDTNFWGAVYVAQEALRFFRDANPTPGGRLLQVSSFLGHACIPSAAFYCAR